MTNKELQEKFLPLGWLDAGRYGVKKGISDNFRFTYDIYVLENAKEPFGVDVYAIAYKSSSREEEICEVVSTFKFLKNRDGNNAIDNLMALLQEIASVIGCDLKDIESRG